ncbi:cell division protein ZapE [Shewanella saliphila]|uniref:Cell division protein ZapE n=2 Tax=Shewanella saliphila TaxID=2282698 RepID=A0ABQ2Q8M6_9GAMM|nr:cell division protein ZapE [Shewanella saliphila]
MPTTDPKHKPTYAAKDPLKKVKNHSQKQSLKPSIKQSLAMYSSVDALAPLASPNSPTVQSMSPLQAYQQAIGADSQHIEKKAITADPAQQEALLALETLYQQFIHSSPIDKGLYLWGDVGRGKTFLMDLFCQCLSQPPKQAQNTVMRLHFHRFMAMLHQQLNQTSGIRDPLTHIAKQIAEQYQIICFDEFFVSDIGDAILLARLFDTLFQSGVTLVATSNIPVVDLYKNGLQRDRFLPTIDLLQQYTHEIHLSGDKDHRLSHQARPQSSPKPTWLKLPSAQTPENMFAQLCKQGVDENSPIEQHHFAQKSKHTLRICQRDIAIQAQHADYAWFEFSALCQGPRSALDYIELAGQFSHILLSDVPLLGGQVRSWIRARGTEDGAQATATGERQLAYASEDDPARRFISLIDEMYDQKVILIIHSQWALEDLYPTGALTFEFRRTYSRLIEMQQWALNAAIT